MKINQIWGTSSFTSKNSSRNALILGHFSAVKGTPFGAALLSFLLLQGWFFTCNAAVLTEAGSPAPPLQPSPAQPLWGPVWLRQTELLRSSSPLGYAQAAPLFKRSFAAESLTPSGLSFLQQSFAQQKLCLGQAPRGFALQSHLCFAKEALLRKALLCRAEHCSAVLCEA